MSASPQTSWTGAFCFLPYRKKPSPAELNSKPQSSNDVLKTVSHLALYVQTIDSGEESTTEQEGFLPYLIAITIESGPTRCSTRVVENPASFIHAAQSLPV